MNESRIAEMEALEEAIVLINERRRALANGSMPAYRIVYRAGWHLEQRLAAMLRGE